MTVLRGDCVEVMAGMEPDSVDAIVCDPPYDLGREPHRGQRTEVGGHRMTRFKWRVLTMAWALALVALPVTVTQTQAIGTYTMTWTGSYWKDPNCGGTAEKFELRLFKDANYAGTQWRVCSDIPNLCYTPYGSGGSDALLCINGYDGDTANDYASSYKVISIEGDSSCRVQLKEHANYAGGGLVEWDPVNRTSAFPYNDAISSVRRVCS